MTPAPDTPARGDAGPRVSDTCLSSWINRAEADYPSRRWDEDFVEVMLDLREDRATIAALRRQVEELQGERDHLSDDLHEARQVPWPKWAKECLRIVRECNGEMEDESDLPEELEELLSEWDDYEAKFRVAEARIADLERRLADAERGGMEKAAEIAKALPLVTTRDNPDIFARNEPYCKHVTTASDAADAIRAAIPAPQEGKPE